MCHPDTQKNEGIAGESGFNGLCGHDWESRELWDGLRAGSVLLWDSLRARSGLLWGGLEAGSGLWVADKSGFRGSQQGGMGCPGMQDSHNMEDEDSPLGHCRTDRNGLHG